MSSTPTWTLSPVNVHGLTAVDVPAHGVTLGRDPSNALVIPGDLHPGVSSRHARVVFEDGAPFLEDLRSLNGTWRNGEKIERAPLRHGDTFELGPGGPRFTLVGRGLPNETMAIHRTAPIAPPTTDNTMILRRKLGITDQEGVGAMLERRSRRHTYLIAGVTGAMVAAIVAGYFLLRERGRQEIASLRTETAALSEELRAARAVIRAQQSEWELAQTRIAAAQAAWVADKANLEQERARIEQSIESKLQALAEDEASKSAQLDDLYRQLEETNASLARFNPLELEKMRLDQVQAVERAVVMIETRAVYEDARTGRPLYVESAPDGSLVPNFDRRGEPVAADSSGSGFAIGPRGHIVTNAHVVDRKRASEPTPIRVDGAEVSRRVELRVVFSRSSERHPARLLRFAEGGDDDLAILTIAPFEGMPHLDALDFDVGLPAPGAEVYLLGFPLGKQALQEGERVIASTFKGIASRRVGPFLQVDAAVHPGNSGGPLIDSAGRVLGVVTAQQAIDAERGSSAIGYVIPIAKVREVWPED